MVVQHNLTAMNSNRMLGITMGTLAKSTEKLSSGYKVNRAADDAAGLSISEKMRKQIRGLTQASLNAADGVSAVQTAEGALTEVHDMLQRMNELAVKAANGTMSTSDRQTIQDEVDQLLTEIDRVAETTKFNETYLLKGDASRAKTTITLNAHDAGLKGAWAVTDSDTTASIPSAKYRVDAVAVGDTIMIGGKEYTIADTTDDSNNKLSVDDAKTKIIAALTVANNVGIAKTEAADGTYTAKDGNTLATVTEGSSVADKYWEFEITKGLTKATKALDFSLHVGADADMTNKISVRIDSMSTAGLKVQGLEVKDGTGIKATYAIDAIADAVAKVSAQRSALGAIQNRLEHTMKNLDNIVENTTAAESQIRDTDMATEMVKYSNTNILAQAGQSMLAQANQANQGVTNLLR